VKFDAPVVPETRFQRDAATNSFIAWTSPVPGVQSRQLVDRVEDESIWLFCPDFADV
jgi:hypothetical protein